MNCDCTFGCPAAENVAVTSRLYWNAPDCTGGGSAAPPPPPHAAINPPNAIYKSQEISGAAVNVALPSAGTYYVVFNNRFGVLAPKSVQDNLTLQYVK